MSRHGARIHSDDFQRLVAEHGTTFERHDGRHNAGICGDQLSVSHGSTDGADHSMPGILARNMCDEIFHDANQIQFHRKFPLFLSPSSHNFTHSREPQAQNGTPPEVYLAYLKNGTPCSTSGTPELAAGPPPASWPVANSRLQEMSSHHSSPQREAPFGARARRIPESQPAGRCGVSLHLGSRLVPPASNHGSEK